MVVAAVGPHRWVEKPDVGTVLVGRAP